MKSLVGYTGFVGSNIYKMGNFDRVYNSRNIEEAYGTCPDLLIYAGMRAEKYLANNAPDKDMELVYQAERNINAIKPKKLVLISTVDVYKKPVDVDETTPIDTEELHAYGLNRYYLECWVREHYPDALIIRLPGLFGINIKKNFIYDYINVIPFMLKAEKFEELVNKDKSIRQYYELQENGFYRCIALEDDDRKRLKETFKKLHFTALNFTDSRSLYQFYPLSRLWNDINIALKHNITLWNPATEPVSVGEVYEYLSGMCFENELGGTPACYDYKTIHADIFGGQDGYIMDKNSVLNEISKFVQSM